MAESLIEPSRAFQSVSMWYADDKKQKKEDQILDDILKIASGTYIEDSNTYKPTTEFVIQAAAVVMIGVPKELLVLVNNFPNGVKMIMLPPGSNDLFQIGYARVAKNPKAKAKDTETVVIVAPQVSWWDRGNNGKKPIHTQQGWREFKYSTAAEKPIKSFPMSNLAKWLPQVEADPPWVFVDENKYWS